MKKRIIGLILAVLTVVSAVPFYAGADAYDDGETCWNCGHYHWGDYMCDTCYACSADCDNSNCYDYTHCAFCGECLMLSDFCEESHLCYNCLQSEGFHCADCNECYCIEDGEPLCGNCFRCPSCVEICPDCGWCYDCAEHCPECDACFPDMCEQGGEHCAECCIENGWICAGCGECVEAKGLEQCDICGCCVDCCEENSCDDCGMCAEEDGFDDHYCEECGACLESVEMCDTCGLCIDCCEDTTAAIGCTCGEYCWAEIDEDHICEDCGQCFGSVDMCETCADVGDYRCVYCCEALSTAEGCDCPTVICTNSPDWDEHFADFHAARPGEHDATPQNTWNFNTEYHWHACRFCDDASHVTGKAAHEYNSLGICKSCGYSATTSIVITVQPRSVKAVVSNPDTDYTAENRISFKVKAYGRDGFSGLHYKWYERYGPSGEREVEDYEDYTYGSDTNCLETHVYTDACSYTQGYYCVITDDYGNSVKSEVAYVRASHDYSNFNPKCSECVRNETGHILECVSDGCSEPHSKLLPHEFTEWQWITVNGEVTGRYRDCTVCGYRDVVKTHTHTYEYEALSALVTDPDATVTGNPDTTGVTVSGYVTSSTTGKKMRGTISPTSHTVECCEKGCTLTSTEFHDWGPWQFIGSETSAGRDGIFRECRVCGYYDATLKYDSEGPIYWEYGVHPIVTVDCDADVGVARNGQTVKITPEKFEGKYLDYYQAAIRYIVYDTNNNPKVRTANLTVNKRDGLLHVPTDYAGKGAITVYAVYKDGCPHGAGEMLNYVAPTCTEPGYTGDITCMDCGHVIVKGEDILPTGHGTPVEVTESVPRTDKNGNVITDKNGYYTYVVQAATTVLCSDTSHVSRSSYTGDKVCPKCGEIVEKGHYTGVEHDMLEVSPKLRLGLAVLAQKIGLQIRVEPTTESDGYSGDLICSNYVNCGKVSYGHILRRLTFTYGDVNSDGKVNISDVTALLKYLAKWDVKINTNAADVNVDSKINVSDVTTILKYLAHWEGVKLGK